MAAATCSDEELLAAVTAHGKAGAARALGISERRVYERWNRITGKGEGKPVSSAAVAPPQTSSPSVSPAERPRVRVRASRTRVMVIGDAHDSPPIPKDRFRWMGKFAGDERPDYIIQIGDLLTLDSLNGHIPNHTLSGRLKGTFEQDIASGRQALDEFNAALPGGYSPQKRITLGNHERRAWLAEEQAPEVAGLMRGEVTDLMEGHGWEWSEYGEFFFLNGVGFVHAALNRLGKTYGGKNAEMTICNDAVFDMVIGHSHTARVWKAPKIGPSQHVTVVNAGCALPHGHVEDYARHNTTGWTWCVAMLDISGSHITDHNFISMASLEERYG